MDNKYDLSSHTSPTTNTPRSDHRNGKDIVDITLRKFSVESGPIHLPSSSHILERLYNDHGVRVRMVRRGRPNRVPTVKEMIDFLSKKHDKLLEMEGKKLTDHRYSAPTPGDTTPRGGDEVLGPRCMSDRSAGVVERLMGLGESRSQSERKGLETERDKLERLVIDSRRRYGQERYTFRVRCPVPFKAPSSRSIVLPVDQESIVLGSSSTPTVPYSTADILYGNDVNKRDAADELRQNSLGELERGGKETSRQNKSRELEHPNNRRPNSKSGSRRSISIDAVSFDKDPDPLKTIPSSLPPAKTTNHFRPNGIRSNLLKGPGDPGYSPKTSNGTATGRDQDDLIATGTEWGYNNNKPPQSSSSSHHPAGASTGHHNQGATSLSSSNSNPQLQQQGAGNSSSSSRLGGGGGNNSNNSYPPKIASSSSSSHQSMSSTTNNTAMVPQRKYASNNIRPIVVQQNNVSGKKLNNKLEDDPKYTDPMIGAPASFQQRIIELGALEGDTVRWERTKRLKKKKQDRDS